jgi:hypothetical protein
MGDEERFYRVERAMHRSQHELLYVITQTYTCLPHASSRSC